MVTRTARWLKACLLFCLLAGTVPVSIATSQESSPANLLRNGSFESGQTGWNAASGSLTISSQTAYDGEHSARVVAPDGSSGNVVQLITASPNSQYRLSGSVWSSKPSDYHSVELQISFLADNKWTERLVRAIPDRTEQWQRFSTAWLDPPTGTEAARVVLHVQPVGGNISSAVLFDGILLEEMRPPASTPTPTATPTAPTADVKINEVLTRPGTDWNKDGVIDRRDEWVELLVAGAAVNLEGWWLDDGPGGSAPYRLEHSANYPGDHKVLLSSQTKLELNDAGDIVRLYRPDGSLADELVVPALDVDASLSRYPDGGKSLSTELVPTFGERNGSRGIRLPPTATPVPTNTPSPTSTPEPTTTPTPTPPTTTPTPAPPLVSIAAARARPPGEVVTVSGSVTAPPDLVASRRMYIQDSSGGILVVVPSGGEAHSHGDLLRITGTTGTYYGEQALRPVEDGVVLAGTGSEVAFKDVSTGAIGRTVEGILVRVHGTITSVGKPSIRLDDGSGEARVRVSETTGIEWPSPRKGDTLAVTGVASSFNGSYRVLPRYAGDLTLVRKQPPLPRKATVLEARNATDGEALEVVGTVTAPPGPLGTSRMYVQDATGGILVTAVPGGSGLRSGDRVRLRGEAGSAFGERRLRLGGIVALQVLARGAPARATSVSPADVGPRTEGLLVEMQGNVIRSSWPSIYLRGGSGSARVYARASTGISNPAARRDDLVHATGIVSRYNDTYRVLPYANQHVRVLERARIRARYEHGTVAQARSAIEGSLVAVRARVTVGPGTYGTRSAYVQDESGGILLTGEIPPLVLGDVVLVQGEAGTYHSEKRLRVHRVTLLYHGPPVSPLVVAPNRIGASTEGMLVRLEGTVRSSGWPSIYVGSPEVRVYVRPSTGVTNPKAREGDTASIVGIVSQWDGKYRLMPRYRADIRIAHKVRSSEPGADTPRRARLRPYRDISLSQVRSLPVGTRVRFEAQVTAPPGVLGKRRVYVGTQDGGLALHVSRGGYAPLAEGDEIRVQGTLDTYYGELVLRLETPRAISRIGPGVPLNAAGVDTEEVGSSMEGRLVRVQARITQRQWPTLYVADGSGETRVRIMDSTSIPRLKGSKGDLAVVTGVVSQWNGKYRLLPRYRTDLTITPSVTGGVPNPRLRTKPMSPQYRLVVLTQVRSLPLGTRVSFRAQVTAVPGVLAKGRAYVGTEGAGIALHLPGGNYPALREGDRVLTRGTLDTYHGELVLRLAANSDIARLGSGTPLAPTVASSREVDALMEGRLVTVHARVTGRQWPTLYADDGSGAMRVRVMAATGIPTLRGGKGSLVTATGIVSQWDGRYRLLPRSAADLHIRPLPRKMPVTGSGGMTLRIGGCTPRVARLGTPTWWRLDEGAEVRSTPSSLAWDLCPRRLRLTALPQAA